MASAAEDVKQMQAQIEKYGSVTQFGVRVQKIEGPAGEDGNTGFINESTGGIIEDTFTGMHYNSKWEIGNWGDTMKFTRR